MFTSYKKLERCYKIWKKEFEEIKPCFKEIKDDKLNAKKEIENYIYNCDNYTGAILFSVFRGNYSEGYNFKGN